MEIFDFSLLVGTDPRSSAEGTLEDLRGYLDEADAGGLVTSLAGAYYDFVSGNADTFELALTCETLLPALTVDPRRLDALDYDFERAAADGARAAVFFPDIQDWPLGDPVARTLAVRAAGAGLPVVLQLGRGARAAEAGAFAAGVEGPVVACGIQYSQVAGIAAAGREVGNLLFGTRLLAGLGNVRGLADRLGPERLVFESWEPVESYLPPLEVLESSGLDESELRLVKTGNAERMFGVTA